MIFYLGKQIKLSLWLNLGLSITFNSDLCLMSVFLLKHASSITHCFWRNVFFSFVFVSHSYYKVFSLQCLLFALAYWNVVFLKLVHFKVWLSFLLQANGACFMNLIWSRHHFLMLKVIVKENCSCSAWAKISLLAFVVDYIQHLEWYPRQDFMLRILLILLANKSSVINLDNYSNDLLGCFFLSCTELLLSIKSLGSSII